MTVDYSNVKSNDENLDAFYTVQEIKVDGNATVNVKLTRPFAQLNIGASDFGLAANANYVPQTSYVKVPVYTTLNLATGEVVETDPAVKTFAYATIPSQDEVFPVDNDKYDYLAMNYLLVGENETVDIEFGHSALDAQSVDFSNLENSRKVGSVPLKRNYRTNIYGKLLTSNPSPFSKLIPLLSKCFINVKYIFLSLTFFILGSFIFLLVYIVSI